MISSDFLLFSRFTLQCLFCPFWHFSPYWLGMKVLCRSAWCHIFDGDTFSFALFIFHGGVFSVSVIVLARNDFPLRTVAVGHFLMLCLFCISFFVYMLCGVFCTGVLCHFSCGVNVINTSFIGEWIMVCWKVIMSAWHTIRWRPMFRYNFYLLSFYNYTEE